MIRTSPEDFKAPGRLAERPPPASVHTPGNPEREERPERTGRDARFTGAPRPRGPVAPPLRAEVRALLGEALRAAQRSGPRRLSAALPAALLSPLSAFDLRITWSCPKSGVRGRGAGKGAALGPV